MIRIYGWFPANLCVTSSGDILVNMYDNDQTRSKAVPYLGSTDKQTTWFDEEGKILFSGNAYIEYITENRNQDICVPYCGACAIVMVNYNQDEETRIEIHVYAFVIPQWPDTNYLSLVTLQQKVRFVSWQQTVAIIAPTSWIRLDSFFVTYIIVIWWIRMIYL